MNQSCGYTGHYCGTGRVQFISRYRNTNDYCVDGRRISVGDDGSISAHGELLDADTIERILIFELEKYADYVLNCHRMMREQNQGMEVPLLPFTFATKPLNSGGFVTA